MKINKGMLLMGVVTISFYFVQLLNENNEMWFKWFSLFAILFGCFCVYFSIDNEKQKEVREDE